MWHTRGRCGDLSRGFPRNSGIRTFCLFRTFSDFTFPHPGRANGRRQHGEHPHDDSRLCWRRGGHGVRAAVASTLLWLVRTKTSPEPSSGTLSCLSALGLMRSLSGRGHGPGWWACPRALSRLYTPSARRRRDPRGRGMDDRTFRLLSSKVPDGVSRTLTHDA